MKALFLIIFLSSVIICTAGNTKKEKLANNPSTEQTAIIINGKIVDSGSQENLVGVKVSIANTNLVAFTDFEGKFSFEIPANLQESEIKVSYISYEETTVKLNGKDDTLIELNQIH
jgi:hypothetical protein